MPEELRFTDAPVHILAGELDDWVPAAACEELVKIANNSGNNLDNLIVLIIFFINNYGKQHNVGILFLLNLHPFLNKFQLF